MAEKVEAITVKINGVETSLNSIRDVKKAIKDLNSQALFGDKEALKNVAELKDKLEDLGDATKSVKGDGIEPLKNSFGLLTDGIGSFDMDKVKTGFSGIGAAMSAMPMFLLVEGFKLLIDNFDKVIDLFKSFTQEAKENERAIRGLNVAYNEVSQNLDEINERQESLIKNGEQRNKLAIEQAKRRGATEKEINDLEIQGTKNKLEVLAKAEENYRKQKEFASSQLSKASQLDNEDAYKKAKEIDEKATEAFLNARKARHDAEREIELQTSQNETEEQQARLEKYKANEEKKIKTKETTQNRFNEIDADLEAANKEGETLDKKLEVTIEKNDEADRKIEANRIETAKRTGEEVRKQTDADIKKAEAAHKASEAAKLQATTNGLNAAQGLSQAYFANQLNHAKGNAQAELAIKKKMFEVDKAFSVARAIIDGIRSVQAALTIPPPGGEILAVVNGVMAAANVAKILTTKFDGGSADMGSISPPSIPSSGGGQVPTINTPQNTTVQPTTTFNSQGQNMNIKAYVVEGEISDAQNQAGKIKRLSSF